VNVDAHKNGFQFLRKTRDEGSQIESNLEMTEVRRPQRRVLRSNDDVVMYVSCTRYLSAVVVLAAVSAVVVRCKPYVAGGITAAICLGVVYWLARRVRVEVGASGDPLMIANLLARKSIVPSSIASIEARRYKSGLARLTRVYVQDGYRFSYAVLDVVTRPGGHTRRIAIQASMTRGHRTEIQTYLEELASELSIPCDLSLLSSRDKSKP
jgi:hypothetical protein